MFPRGVSRGCGCRPMVIDGRGYYRALGPTFVPYSGSILAPRHQLDTTIPPAVPAVRGRRPAGGGESFLSQDWFLLTALWFQGSRHGGSSGTIVQTPTTGKGWHMHRDWRCCCNTVTKQQEASHTDHWHCIVMEIWVSVSFLSSLFPSLSLIRASFFLLFFIRQTPQTWLYFRLKHSWVEPPLQLSSSTYSCSATLKYLVFRQYSAPPSPFLCGVLHFFTINTLHHLQLCRSALLIHGAHLLFSSTPFCFFVCFFTFYHSLFSFVAFQ